MKYDNLTFEEMADNLRSAVASTKPCRIINESDNPNGEGVKSFTYVKIDANSIATGRLTADRILFKGEFEEQSPVRIKKVVFNNPATIVFWEDGTKTVVKAYDEEFDKEKGLAMAIIKKLHNNKGNFNNLFRKWIPE